MFYGRGIRRWLAAGPFLGDNLDAASHLAEEASLRPLVGQSAGDAVWTTVEHLGYSAEVLDFSALGDQANGMSNYAFTLVKSDREQKGFLWLGYDERIRVWLNGEVVYEDPSRHVFALADKRIPIRLREGENRLLLKVGNFMGSTSLAVHVVDEDGDRLFGTRFALPGDTPTAVETEVGEALPKNPALLGNYPNPFNPATFVRFALPRAEKVELSIFDLAGQQIRSLRKGELPAGYHEELWDGRDSSGFRLASGVYLVRLRASTWQRSHAMLLLR